MQCFSKPRDPVLLTCCTTQRSILHKSVCTDFMRYFVECSLNVNYHCRFVPVLRQSSGSLRSADTVRRVHAYREGCLERSLCTAASQFPEVSSTRTSHNFLTDARLDTGRCDFNSLAENVLGINFAMSSVHSCGMSNSSILRVKFNMLGCYPCLEGIFLGFKRLIAFCNV